MLQQVRTTIDRATWHERGFALSRADVTAIDGFFKPWFEVYRRPGVAAYESQEAVFAVHHGMVTVVGDSEPGKRSQWAVSALRAGYCVARVEQTLGLRPVRDENLRTLFELMEKEERWPAVGDAPARPIVVGKRIGELAERMALDQPQMAAEIAGFPLREAVFADLRATLFVKLTVTSFPVRFDQDRAETLMRFGHAVGFIEESLPRVTRH